MCARVLSLQPVFDLKLADKVVEILDRNNIQNQIFTHVHKEVTEQTIKDGLRWVPILSQARLTTKRGLPDVTAPASMCLPFRVATRPLLIATWLRGCPHLQACMSV